MFIHFYSDHYYPETNAAAARVHERAKYLVAMGHRVVVMTCCPNFPYGRPFKGYTNTWYMTERIDDVQVVRFKTYMAPNKGFVRRSLDFLSYLPGAFFAGLGQGRPDIIVGCSPHLLAPFAAWLVSVVKRVPFVLEVADIWPDSVVAVGAARKDGMAVRWLRGLERHLYRVSDGIVALTDGIRHHIVGQGGDPEKVVVIENGVEVEQIKSVSRDDRLRHALFDDGIRFVLGYIGTLGVAQQMSAVVEQFLSINDPSLGLLLVGPGAEHEKIRALIECSGDRRIALNEPVPRSEVARFWAVCDAAILSLRPDPGLYAALPSKLFEIAAAGKPVIMIGPEEGEACRFVKRTGMGLILPSSGLCRLVSVIDELRDNRQLSERCIEAGSSVACVYTRRRQAELLAGTLENLVA